MISILISLIFAVVESNSGASWLHEDNSVLDSAANNIQSFGITTGPGVVKQMTKWLNDASPIDENAYDHYGSQDATSIREKECGWNPITNDFINPQCIDTFDFKTTFTDNNILDPKSIDIVTPTIRDLDFFIWFITFISPTDVRLIFNFNLFVRYFSNPILDIIVIITSC